MKISNSEFNKARGSKRGTDKNRWHICEQARPAWTDSRQAVLLFLLQGILQELWNELRCA